MLIENIIVTFAANFWKEQESNLPKFKYQDEIDIAISQGCALPVLHEPCGMTAYRFVFDHEHPNNFLPPLKIKPQRRLDASIRVTGYALSCFEDMEKAKNQYVNLAKTFRNIKTEIGDCLSSGKIENNDGLVDDTSLSTSHFNLFEFEGCDLSKKFEIQCKL